MLAVRLLAAEDIGGEHFDPEPEEAKRVLEGALFMGPLVLDEEWTRYGHASPTHE